MRYTIGSTIGSTIDIIYIDRKGTITQRRVVVRSVDGRILRGYCLQRQANRPFLLANILAAQLARHAG